VVICLERGADMHIADVTATHYPDWFYLLVLAQLGSPEQRAVKRVCVCEEHNKYKSSTTALTAKLAMLKKHSISVYSKYITICSECR